MNGYTVLVPLTAYHCISFCGNKTREPKLENISLPRPIGPRHISRCRDTSRAQMANVEQGALWRKKLVTHPWNKQPKPLKIGRAPKGNDRIPRCYDSFREGTEHNHFWHFRPEKCNMFLQRLPPLFSKIASAKNQRTDIGWWWSFPTLSTGQYQKFTCKPQSLNEHSFEKKLATLITRVYLFHPHYVHILHMWYKCTKKKLHMLIIYYTWYIHVYIYTTKIHVTVCIFCVNI